jgi:crotonobetainyl-CoA:carnitine CoA-transferase CaiB-like acyl-CoA transferase
MGGLVSMTGTADGTVMKCGPSVGDLYSGALNAVGLLAAVIDAQRTGVGQFVDVAMYDAVLSLTESAVYRYSCSGTVPRPTGNGHPQIAPFDIFPTADGNCGIGAPGEMFARLCALMDRPELAEDERFATFADRLANRPALNAEIVAWTSTRTTADIVRLLGGVVAVGPVNDMAAVWSDPHVAARGMLVRVEQPDGSRPLTLAGQPIKMTKSGTGVRSRPPRLNEHAADIVTEAGLDR